MRNHTIEWLTSHKMKGDLVTYARKAAAANPGETKQEELARKAAEDEAYHTVPDTRTPEQKAAAEEKEEKKKEKARNALEMANNMERDLLLREGDKRWKKMTKPKLELMIAAWKLLSFSAGVAAFVPTFSTSRGDGKPGAQLKADLELAVKAVILDYGRFRSSANEESREILRN